MKNKIIILTIMVGALISAILASLLGAQTLVYGAGASNTSPVFYFASSTVFTLTTASQRLLATSTPTHRVAATFQPVNCTTGSGLMTMNLNRDVAATANSGMGVYASTTMELKDYPNLPVVQGSVQGIMSAGTCTVLVTEWRLVQ